jgi:hypothetical protein
MRPPPHTITPQVALQRQMDRGSRDFADFRRQRDTELLQLKKQGRLNAAQMQKLEALHIKQQAVLRRKTGGPRCCAASLQLRCTAAVLPCRRDPPAMLQLPLPQHAAFMAAEEAEAARRRLKKLEERQKAAASSRPASSAAPPASAADRPFTAPPASGAPAPPSGRPPLPGGGGERPERSATSVAALSAAAESECQPNAMAPLLRDEKSRREWVEAELDAHCSSFELQARRVASGVCALNKPEAVCRAQPCGRLAGGVPPSGSRRDRSAADTHPPRLPLLPCVRSG